MDYFFHFRDLISGAMVEFDVIPLRFLGLLTFEILIVGFWMNELWKARIRLLMGTDFRPWWCFSVFDQGNYTSLQHSHC